MTKDQLGWDQILQTAQTSEEEEADSKSPVKTEDAVEPRALPVEKKASRKKRSRTVKAADSDDTSQDHKKPEKSEVTFSDKNWGPLEIERPRETSSPKPSALEKPKSIFAEPKEEAPEEEELSSEEPAVYSVSELNKNIRDILEGRFPLIWLKGEISNFKAHTSGHFYFSLKDAKAQINAVMFRGFNSQLRFRPEDGMEVLVRGKITVYEPRGNYQIFCESMEPVGAGALQKAYEQLKAKLQSEGLFDTERKREIPALPRHIAIVTSPTGAAIRDMLNVLGRRFKAARITLVPCKVQGEQAPAEIVQAISLANRLDDVDVMIVGRGGGSIEDLWAFNDEGVARAIANSGIPVISAVGHEVDFTIADFVADLRAPTPSAAAELVVKNAADLMDRVANLRRGLHLLIKRQFSSLRETTAQMSKRLIDPQRRLQDSSIRCDELMQRLEAGIRRLFSDRRMRVELLKNRMGTPLHHIAREHGALSGWSARLRTSIVNVLIRKRESMELQMAVLDSLSPLKVLDRGYSMVMVNGKVVTQANLLKVGSDVQVRMGQGSFEAEVKKIDSDKR